MGDDGAKSTAYKTTPLELQGLLMYLACEAGRLAKTAEEIARSAAAENTAELSPAGKKEMEDRLSAMDGIRLFVDFRLNLDPQRMADRAYCAADASSAWLDWLSRAD